MAATAVAPGLALSQLGRADYLATYAAMREFTLGRTDATPLSGQNVNSPK